MKLLFSDTGFIIYFYYLNKITPEKPRNNVNKTSYIVTNTPADAAASALEP
jgi:hypothetical protein